MTTSPTPLERARSSLKGLRRRKTAFVFSGGGNLGAVQVGMIKALFDADIEPDLVIGCSVGAINGAAIAGEPGRMGLRRLERLWGRLADGKPDLMPRSFLPLAVQMARRGDAMHDQGILEQLLREELLVDRIEDLRIPFAAVATRVDTADEHWFTSGELVPAILASAALPAVYGPVTVNGHRYIDGGVAREAPVAKAVEMGATDVYFFHLGHLEGRDRTVHRPFDAAIHSYWALRYRRLVDDLDRVRDECNLVVLPSGVRPRLRFDDFSKGRQLIALAHDATAHFLATGETTEPVDIRSGDDKERARRSTESIDPAELLPAEGEQN